MCVNVCEIACYIDQIGTDRIEGGNNGIFKFKTPAITITG